MIVKKKGSTTKDVAYISLKRKYKMKNKQLIVLMNEKNDLESSLSVDGNDSSSNSDISVSSLETNNA